jgi:hypothetical protein
MTPADQLPRADNHPCPVCRAPLRFGAHVCLKCRSLVRLPRAVLYIAAVVGSIPVYLALFGVVVELRRADVSRTERGVARGVEVAKDGANALESLMEMAGSIYLARYHLGVACDPYFRDPDFFELKPSEGCIAQMLHALSELDQQMVKLAYGIEIVPIARDTRRRFDGLNANYWNPDGYRQRVLNALHATGGSQAQIPLRACGPHAAETDIRRCAFALSAIKKEVLHKLGDQADAALCSLVRDIQSLRTVAYEGSFEVGYADTDESAPAKMWRALVKDQGLTSSCATRLRKVAIDYRL